VSEPGDAIRVSDAERDAVVRTLGDHASVGRLTLEELEERSGKALAAKTRGDLAALTSDLPAPGEVTAGTAGPAASPPAARPRRPVRWIVTLIGGGFHTGRFRAVGSINVAGLISGAVIDLRNAEIEGGELTVNSFALIGGVNVYVPDTLEVETGGFSLLGGAQETGSLRDPRPGAPVIRIRGFALIGGPVVYRVPPDMRGKSAREIHFATMRGQLSGRFDDGPGEFGFGPGRLRSRDRSRGGLGGGGLGGGGLGGGGLGGGGLGG
jgi:hypothetical protein